jgi:hypothetical protein
MPALAPCSMQSRMPQYSNAIEWYSEFNSGSGCACRHAVQQIRKRHQRLLLSTPSSALRVRICQLCASWAPRTQRTLCLGCGCSMTMRMTAHQGASWVQMLKERRAQWQWCLLKPCHSRLLGVGYQICVLSCVSSTPLTSAWRGWRLGGAVT